MPTIITHGFVAFIAGKMFAKDQSWRFWMISVACSIIPDVDAIGFKFGIPYGHLFGHRGFTHSILFGIIIGFFVVLLFYRSVPRYSSAMWSLSGYFSILIISHGIFDAMTDGGLGVAFFSPFVNERYFLPFTPIKVAPISVSEFFTESSYGLMLNEILWIWLPLSLLLIAPSFFRTVRRSRRLINKSTGQPPLIDPTQDKEFALEYLKALVVNLENQKKHNLVFIAFDVGLIAFLFDKLIIGENAIAKGEEYRSLLTLTIIFLALSAGLYTAWVSIVHWCAVEATYFLATKNVKRASEKHFPKNEVFKRWGWLSVSASAFLIAGITLTIILFLKVN